MSKIEYRANNGFSAVGDNDDYKLEGYFILFDVPTMLFSDYYEVIERSAVPDDISSYDIRALFNHEPGKVLGRTTNKTLALRKDNKGLWGSILVNKDDSEAMSIYQRVKRQDISQCSFGFYENNPLETPMPDHSIMLRHKSIELVEVSIVTFPQYEQTSIEARTKDYEKRLLNEEINKYKERLKNGIAKIEKRS